VRRFASLMRPGGRVLDLAAGGGRHTRLLLDMGFVVDAVDRDISRLEPLTSPCCRVRKIDLENGQPWELGGGWDGIVVTNYLYRPLFPDLVTALAEGGVLIYETFMLGNERFGRPHNPNFLLQARELLDAFAVLSVIAFEQGEVGEPRPTMIQRIAAVNGSIGHLPSPVFDNDR
jgi:SAM-dependent methyltransferase